MEETTPEAFPQSADTQDAETLSVPDMVASAALALTAISEIASRANSLYESLHGISAAARADLAFVLAVLNSAKSKL